MHLLFFSTSWSNQKSAPRILTARESLPPGLQKYWFFYGFLYFSNIEKIQKSIMRSSYFPVQHVCQYVFRNRFHTKLLSFRVKGVLEQTKDSLLWNVLKPFGSERFHQLVSPPVFPVFRIRHLLSHFLGAHFFVGILHSLFREKEKQAHKYLNHQGS